MNFNENYLWRDKAKSLKLRCSKLHSAKVLPKLEIDTRDQVLFFIVKTIIMSQKLFENFYSGYESFA